MSVFGRLSEAAVLKIYPEQLYILVRKMIFNVCP
jgi:hypothetical protein